MHDEAVDNEMTFIIPVRDAAPDEITAIPRRKYPGGKPLMTLHKSACIVIDNSDGTSTLHLAGYITDTKIRMTSAVVAYDPDNGHVETRNSLYHISSPPGETDDYLKKSICMLLLKNMGATTNYGAENKTPTIH